MDVQQTLDRLRDGLERPTPIAPLVYLRVVFALVLLWELFRWSTAGWIEANVIAPSFHFTYYGFSWVRPLPGAWAYAPFVWIGIGAAAMIAGVKYRLAAITTWLSFTYVYLIDQTYDQNHWYLMVLLGFLLAVSPAGQWRSWDAARDACPSTPLIAAGWLWLFRFQIAIVYFFGGITKLNSDWLAGEPLRTWFHRFAPTSPLGSLLTQEPVIYFVSYSGILFDLFIVPALLWRRTRVLAVVSAVVFHGFNALHFNIGVFPLFMTAATLIFLPADSALFRLIGGPKAVADESEDVVRPSLAPWVRHAMIAYCVVQFLVPLRHWVLPGDVAWNNAGGTFAWRMMNRSFQCRGPFLAQVEGSPRKIFVPIDRYLTPLQASRFYERPDMILQFAHHVSRVAAKEVGRPVKISALLPASLNTRTPAQLVDPDTDLAAQPRTIGSPTWVRPFEDTPLGGLAEFERRMKREQAMRGGEHPPPPRM